MFALQLSCFLVSYLVRKLGSAWISRFPNTTVIVEAAAFSLWPLVHVVFVLLHAQCQDDFGVSNAQVQNFRSTDAWLQSRCIMTSESAFISWEVGKSHIKYQYPNLKSLIIKFQILYAKSQKTQIKSLNPKSQILYKSRKLCNSRDSCSNETNTVYFEFLKKPATVLRAYAVRLSPFPLPSTVISYFSISVRSSKDSAVVDDKLLRLARIIEPATLNKRSTEADVAGALGYFLASRANVGYLSEAEHQKTAGLSVPMGSKMYTLSSGTWGRPWLDCAAPETRLHKNFANILFGALADGSAAWLEVDVEDEAVVADLLL